MSRPGMPIADPAKQPIVWIPRHDNNDVIKIGPTTIPFGDLIRLKAWQAIEDFYTHEKRTMQDVSLYIGDSRILVVADLQFRMQSPYVGQVYLTTNKESIVDYPSGSPGECIIASLQGIEDRFACKVTNAAYRGIREICTELGKYKIRVMGTSSRVLHYA